MAKKDIQKSDNDQNQDDSVAAQNNALRTASAESDIVQEPTKNSDNVTSSREASIIAVNTRILDQLDLMTDRIAAIENGQQNRDLLAAQTYQPYPTQEGCGCSKEKCCCFDVIMNRARVLERQMETEDGLTGSHRNLEMIFHVTANGFSGIYPSLNSHIQLSEKSGWVSVNKKVTQIRVGGTKSIPVMAEAREVENNALGFRPEHGSSGEFMMNLACGCPTIPLLIEIPLTGGGRGGGRVEIEVAAREACCDMC